MEVMFRYQEPFPLGKDSTPYRLLTREGVKLEKLGAAEILRVDPKVLVTLAREALSETSWEAAFASA